MHEEQPPVADLDIAILPASKVDRLAMARHLLDGIQVQIRTADEKIRVLFGGTALLAAALAFPPQNTLTNLAAGGFTPVEIAFVVTHLLVLVFVIFSITAAILALLPRGRRGKVERSLYFFGHIGATPHDTFVEEFRGLPEDTVLRQVLSQVHVNSRIVATKYTWTYRAASAFAVAVVLLVIKQALALFL